MICDRLGEDVALRTRGWLGQSSGGVVVEEETLRARGWPGQSPGAVGRGEDQSRRRSRRRLDQEEKVPGL